MSCLYRFVRCFYLLFAVCIVWNSAQNIQGESNINHDSSFFFYRRPDYPRDCKEILSECSTLSSSRVYLIKPDGYPEPLEVFCYSDIDSGGWTVIQRRMDGSVSFNRNWKEYKKGFGFLSSEVWLGNEKLSFITNQAAYELRIDMVLSNGASFYIEYSTFRISDEWSSYYLSSVEEYNGNASSVITTSPPNTNFVNSTCQPTVDTEIFTDCYLAYEGGHRHDGVYTIRPSGWTGDPFKVPCNMSIDGGGWTVLQRRSNGSENFDLNWEKYKNGFGVPDHELWLGNDKIYYLTNQGDYELRMDMVNLDGDAYFAKYDLFRITDESCNYQLVALGAYDTASTTGFDAMAYHRNQFFSTPDNDNDPFSYNCAADSYYRSGWWYGDDIDNIYCDYCNFNSPGFGVYAYNCPYWYYLPGNNCLMYTDIKIRPV